MKRPRLTAARLMPVMAVAVIVLLLASDGFRRDIVLIALSFSLCAAATDHASGYAGLRTLGPILPFGIGAYAHGIIMARGGDFGASLLAAPPLAALAGGSLCLLFVGARRDAGSWSVFGLAGSIAVEQIARAATDLTGGSNGMLVTRYFGTPATVAGFASFAAAACFAGTAWLLRESRGAPGARVLLAHFEPDRLQSHGISLARVRAVAVARQWGLSALAGVVFAAASGAVDPSIFGVENNLVILIACTLFGERTILGPCCAAFLIVATENAFGSIWAGWQTLLLGLCLIAILFARNSGWRWPRRLAGPAEA